MTSIINLKKIAGDLNEWAKHDDHVYIGRYNPLLPDACTDWGNPHRPEDEGMDACIKNYRIHILSKPEMMSRLPELQGKVLGCWCRPGTCHGEALIELMNSFLTTQYHEESLEDDDEEEEIDITILSNGSDDNGILKDALLTAKLTHSYVESANIDTEISIVEGEVSINQEWNDTFTRILNVSDVPLVPNNDNVISTDEGDEGDVSIDHERYRKLLNVSDVPLTTSQTTQTDKNFNKDIMDKLKHFENIILQVINTNMEIREDLLHLNKKIEDNFSNYINDAREKIERENQFFTRIENVERSLNSDKIDEEASLRLDNLEKLTASLQSDNISKENDLVILSAKIESLESELNKLNTYGRRENIEISGLPENISDENLEYEVIGFLRTIGVENLCYNEISACHRLQHKVNGENHRRVIVRFVNRKRAEQCFQNRRNIRYRPKAGKDVYIHENMSPANKKLMDKCEYMKDAGLLETYWFFKGTVHIRRHNEKYRSVRILHNNDLDRYVPCVNRALDVSNNSQSSASYPT